MSEMKEIGEQRALGEKWAKECMEKHWPELEATLRQQFKQPKRSQLIEQFAPAMLPILLKINGDILDQKTCDQAVEVAGMLADAVLNRKSK